MNINDYLKLCAALELDLEDATSGPYRLNSAVYSPGTTFPIIPNNYQSFLMGHSPTSISLEKPFRLYEIRKGNEVVMTNAFLEMYKLYEAFLRSRGNVLIGGYGMGLLTRLLCQKDNVNNVVSIENSKDVLTLCPYKHDKLELLEMDFFDYLYNEDLNKFDYLFIDIYVWGDEYYHDVVIPTRNYLLEKYPTLRFDFWQEDLLKFRYLQQHNKHPRL